jgi:hypothetical protein
MPDDVLLVVKLRVKRSDADAFKEELEDIVRDFVDENIATQEGDIETEEIPS